MSKNHYLAKSILDSGFYEFRRQLEYKSKLYGNKIFINDRYYPSSKLCAVCGKKTNRLKNISTLNIRNWQCDKCQTNHDRDINASVNLVKNAVSSTVSACGEFYTADLDTQYLNQVSSIEAGRKHQMNTFE
jgi:putative transposase